MLWHLTCIIGLKILRWICKFNLPVHKHCVDINPVLFTGWLIVFIKVMCGHCSTIGLCKVEKSVVYFDRVGPKIGWFVLNFFFYTPASFSQVILTFSFHSLLHVIIPLPFLSSNFLQILPPSCPTPSRSEFPCSCPLPSQHLDVNCNG